MFESWFPAHWSTLKKLMYLRIGSAGGGTPVTLTGSIVSFLASKSKPIKSLVVNIEPQQAGSGDPSPDNVRAISGWAGCEIEQRNGNLLTDVPIRKINGAIPSGNKIVGDNFLSTFVYAVPKATLYLQHPGNDTTYYGFSDSSDLIINDDIELIGSVRWGKQLTFTDNGYKYLYITDSKAKTCFNKGSLTTASSSVILPVGIDRSLPIQFTDPSTGDPLTVYGGTLTINEDGSGELVSTNAIKDMGSLAWTRSATGYHRFDATLTGAKRTANEVTVLCEIYKAITNRQNSNFNANNFDLQICMATNTQSPVVMVQDAQCTTAADFKAAVTGYNIVYDLSTPIIYTLTAQQISTLIGENNVWADAGDVTVTAAGVTPITEGE